MNKIQIMGYLDQDPEILTKKKEHEKVNLILSNTTAWQDEQGHWKKQTNQHFITVFKPFFIAWIKEESFKKGDHLFVQGIFIYEETLRRKKKQPRIIVEGRWGQILRIHENDPQQKRILAKAGITRTIPITIEVPNEA